MDNKLQDNKKGFTIIEVVLVLAIAGLIFLIVFIALPQLQASRRDTQRRNDAGRLVSAGESAASNRNGSYPTLDQAFINTYLADSAATQAVGPSGENYTYVALDSTTKGIPTTSAEGSISGGVGYTCDTTAENKLAGSGASTSRDFAILMRLEQGTYCQDNQ